MIFFVLFFKESLSKIFFMFRPLRVGRNLYFIVFFVSTKRRPRKKSKSLFSFKFEFLWYDFFFIKQLKRKNHERKHDRLLVSKVDFFSDFPVEYLIYLLIEFSNLVSFIEKLPIIICF